MGRNIFQSSDPVGMIKAVGAVVHKKSIQKKHMIYSNLIKINLNFKYIPKNIIMKISNLFTLKYSIPWFS